jgi:tryptophan halogenase
MSAMKKKRIVIAGGGTAGWSAAVILSGQLSNVFDISLVESEAIGTVGVGEATIPTIRDFHKMAGVDETEFIKATSATYKLGIRFEGWKTEDESYYHAFGTTGIDHWSSGFQHFWLGAKEFGENRPYRCYSRESVAASKGKFSSDGGLAYAYHLDSSLYGKFLRSLSEKRGVDRIEGIIKEVLLDKDDGGISSLLLEDGRQIVGDFFIDCTGFRGLLIGQALGVGSEDWSDVLVCNRAIAVQTELKGEPVPYTRSIAHKAGWRWQIPLQHRVGNGTIYSSDHISDDEALSMFLGDIDGEPLTEPNHIKFLPSMRKKQWYKNCVAIGLSSGFLEPLESTSIHMIQYNLLRLVRLLALETQSEASVAEYNRQVEAEIINTRDFLILHYWQNQRKTDEFWERCREMEIGDSLRHRVQLFEDSGSVFRHMEDIFTENSWVQVLLGQGVEPSAYHPKVKALSGSHVIAMLNRIYSDVEKETDKLPSHGEFLGRYGYTQGNNHGDEASNISLSLSVAEG